MKTIMIVDLQKDFCPGGALPAPDGQSIIPIINTNMSKFDLILASRDKHPQKSKHFEKWPNHCIKGTEGVQYHSNLDTSQIMQEFEKGTGKEDDGYSAFEATNQSLEKYLNDKGVRKLYLSGLTTEYCIKNTALDAARKGFKTYVLLDAIAAVEPESEHEHTAIKEMEDAGVVFTSMKSI